MEPVLASEERPQEEEVKAAPVTVMCKRKLGNGAECEYSVQTDKRSAQALMEAHVSAVHPAPEAESTDRKRGWQARAALARKRALAFSSSSAMPAEGRKKAAARIALRERDPISLGALVGIGETVKRVAEEMRKLQAENAALRAWKERAQRALGN